MSATVVGNLKKGKDKEVIAINNQGRYVSEEEYWEDYYECSEANYEWNNGILEEKPVSDYLTFIMYQWFMNLLQHYFKSNAIGKMIGLEMGFRLALPNKVVIRKPDLGILTRNNPKQIDNYDHTYRGILNICIEALSDSELSEIIRDTVTKKEEYAQGGVKEYYILSHREEYIEFYRLDKSGVYCPIKPTTEGVIKSIELPGFQFRFNDLFIRPDESQMIQDPVYQGYVALKRQQERFEKEQALAEKEQERFEKEQALAEKEQALAEKEQERFEKEQALAEKERLLNILKKLGINPN